MKKFKLYLFPKCEGPPALQVLALGVYILNRSPGLNYPENCCLGQQSLPEGSNWEATDFWKTSFFLFSLQPTNPRITTREDQWGGYIKSTTPFLMEKLGHVACHSKPEKFLEVALFPGASCFIWFTVKPAGAGLSWFWKFVCLFVKFYNNKT